MKRSDTLKRKKDFRYTYRVGKSVQHRYFSCITARNREERPLVGITVSKKQGNSVQRNRIKRRIREVLTPWIPKMRDGMNLVIVGKHSVLEAPFESLVEAMEKVLKDAKALKDM